MMLKAKQKGFTLLELLVVITLLAILSVGALVAYDGLTEKAQASATSNNTARLTVQFVNTKSFQLNIP